MVVKPGGSGKDVWCPSRLAGTSLPLRCCSISSQRLPGPTGAANKLLSAGGGGDNNIEFRREGDIPPFPFPV